MEYTKERKQNLALKLETLRKKVNGIAEKWLDDEIPKKLQHLSNVLSKELPPLEAKLSTVPKISRLEINLPEENPKKKRKLNDATASSENPIVWRKKAPRTPEELARLKTEVPANPVISHMNNLVKRELLDLVDCASSVKIYIMNHFPKMEDGNNFGASVQEEMVDTCATIEENSFSQLSAINEYHRERGKAVSKVLKWPDIPDYQENVSELDSKQSIKLRCVLREVKHHFVILLDNFRKNKEKILRPKGTMNKQKNAIFC